MTKTYDARDIARWFVAWAADFDEGAVTNLKLQKLLYYAQGTALATWGRPLFSQPVEAWMHGPVVCDVYHEYKSFGTNGIELDPDDEMDWSITDAETNDLLASVWRTYGGYSAWRLREMTHAEDPWKSTYHEGERSSVIDLAVIREYFEGLFRTQPARRA